MFDALYTNGLFSVKIHRFIDAIAVTDTEKAVANSYRTDANRLGFCTLLKCFQHEGKFPNRKQDISKQIILHIGPVQTFVSPGAREINQRSTCQQNRCSGLHWENPRTHSKK